MVNVDTPSPKEKFLAERTQQIDARGNILDSATVYLSGPMDFVPDRDKEKRVGWRTRVSQFLEKRGTTVYDPWNKPPVLGLPNYGKEDEFTAKAREGWIYEDSANGSRIRAELCEAFWPTLHIDLRMTDLADFVIAYCPTNIYSVGTVHEIAMARQQHKPVLLVTPRLASNPTAQALRSHLAELNDAVGQELLDTLEKEGNLLNPNGIPSLWYMAMLESEDYFFDGFGFEAYRDEMGWTEQNDLLDPREADPDTRPRRPLLPYLDELNRAIPSSYSVARGADHENADWLIFVDADTETAQP
jgi:hypothetical protein